MDQLLLIAHLLGLMLVAAAFLPLLGLMGQGSAAPQTNRLLTQFGHWGIIVLLVSGPILLFVRYGGFDGVSHWFWAKMALVLLLAAGVVTSAVSARKMRAGDAAATSRVRIGRIIAVLSLLGTVVFAVLAFG
ncbi:MAG: hypothetical protein EON57_05285 [Alphaproteobacteria bacterium]|nr:MAG: hypothetical protein EON57_05285 [Alphaproteobacteria bacterium]